jgi:blue copper oxidase
MIERRQILTGLAVAGGRLALGGLVAPNLLDFTASPGTGSARELAAPKIPPLMPGSLTDGRREFDLRLEAGASRLHRSQETPTIGINGAYLGPTLEMNAGETVRMNITNRLDEAATLHWH